MATHTISCFLIASNKEGGTQTDDYWTVGGTPGLKAWWDVWSSNLHLIPYGSYITSATVYNSAWTDGSALVSAGTFAISAVNGSKSMTMPKTSGSNNILPLTLTPYYWIFNTSAVTNIGTVMITNNENFYTATHNTDKYFSIEVGYYNPPDKFFMLSHNS